MPSCQTLTSKEGLAVVRKAIRADLRSVGADPSLAFDCLVAVTEASTNALIHGVRPEDTQPPQVMWEIDGTQAVFQIQDYSTEQWSRTMHPSRDSADPLEGDAESRVGGYGLQLMRELMDDVSIARGPLGTTVTLTKKLRAPVLRS
jgi:anti-sigma regulatory factor (Ser/Thr protein kinase)